MNNPHPNLSYEFYFLFNLEFEQQCQREYQVGLLDDDFIEAGLQGVKVDEDKRLLRYTPLPSEAVELPPLEQWNAQLQQAWEQIVAHYYDLFLPEDEKYKPKQLDKEKSGIQNKLQKNLWGVSLLIMDETVDEDIHQIRLNTTLGEVVFKSVAELPSKKILLKVIGEAADMPITQIEEFKPECGFVSDTKHWQIKLSTTQPIELVPMRPEEDSPNSVLSVYALAHGVLPDYLSDEQGWGKQLHYFLCSGKAAVMMRILPRLMMQQWQFKRIDLAADKLRKKLDVKNEAYQKANEVEVECANNKQLTKGLRDMQHIAAEAQLVLARLETAKATLEINRHNLQLYLQSSEETWQILDKNIASEQKYNWHLSEKNQTDSPMLDGFSLDVQRVCNHKAYIQAALRYLEGLQARWKLHIEGRRLSYEANIQESLLVLTFVASFTGVVAFIIQNPKEVSSLLGIFTDNPEQITKIGRFLLIGVNSLILTFFVLPFFVLYLRAKWRRGVRFIRRYLNRRRS